MPRALNSLWGRVLTDGHDLGPCRVELAHGQIVAVAPAGRPNGESLVVQEGWIAAGLIDLQVNGAGGVDLTSAADPPAALAKVARTLAQHGVTSFCPTIVSSRRELIVSLLAPYRRGPVATGAESLGTHVEGPFLNPEFRGVHDPTVLRDASPDEIDAWLDAGPPAIVSLAPERDGGLAAIRHLSRAGILVSLGHSGADAPTAQEGLANGARMGTHLFNGMPPLHHRRPALVGALLASSAFLELITDGVHVDPLLVDLVVRRAGSERVILVSDALAPAGCSPGWSVLGDQAVEFDGRSVRRADGTLAGSALLLDGCLANLRRWLTDLPPAALVRMANQTPADALGISRKGRLAVGCDADMVVLDDDLNVCVSIVRAQVVHDARHEPG
jgi:N-acetylglucosamine-6-phosphate deacetylase